MIGRPAPVDAGERGATAVAGVILQHAEVHELEQGNLLQRLTRAAWMLVATPVDGSHYFIDVLAGIALAALSLLLAQATTARAASHVAPHARELAHGAG